MIESDVMTIDEVARWLRKSVRWVSGLVRKGEIPSAKIHGSRLFSKKELEAWFGDQVGGDKDGKSGK